MLSTDDPYEASSKSSEDAASSASSQTLLMGQGSEKLLTQLRRQHVSDSSAAHTQLWKLNDTKSLKEGSRKGIYWVKQKQEDFVTRNFRLSKESYKKKWQTGSTYTGDWLNNQMHGYGTKIWPNGNKYEGEWSMGLRHGHGTFWVKVKDENGEKLRKIYTGNWTYDLKEGMGAYFYKTGGRYEGEWKKGLRHGEGKMFYVSEDSYSGDWIEDKRCGYGRVIYANGDCYEGEWLNDKKEGPGEYFYKSRKKVYVGEWVNDVPQCGVYSSADFAEDVDPVTGVRVEVDPPPPFSYKTMGPLELPELELVDPDSILEREIGKIRDQRDAIRAAPLLEPHEMFNEQDLVELRCAFAALDTDAQGSIEISELQNGFNVLGQKISDSELAIIFVSLDKDENGSVSYPEFVRTVFLARQRIVFRDRASQGGDDESRSVSAMTGSEAGESELDRLSGFDRESSEVLPSQPVSN
eukprot:257518_1